MKFWYQVSPSQTLVFKLDEYLWFHTFLNRLGNAKKIMQTVTLKSMKLLIQSFEL